jgi:hypothetical protein
MVHGDLKNELNIKEKTNTCTSSIFFFSYLFAVTCFGRLIRPSSECSTIKSTTGYDTMHPSEIEL